MRPHTARGGPSKARLVRLPSEAEWEFAARGRQAALFPWGDVMPEWIPNGGHGPLQAPWPVTLGEPTDFGLLGIATNVHEWCADWYDQDYYSRSPERNPAVLERRLRQLQRALQVLAVLRCTTSAASSRSRRRRWKTRFSSTPNAAMYSYHLGVVHAKAGEDAKARKALERAIQLDSKSAFAADARKTLATLVY